MAKKIALLLLPVILVMGAPCATTYRILRVDLKTDSSLGVFTRNGKTFGYIVGVAYTIEATSDGGGKSQFTSDFWVTPPRESFPTLANIKNAVRADAVSKGAKEKMDSALIRGSIDAQPFIPVFGEDVGF